MCVKKRKNGKKCVQKVCGVCVRAAAGAQRRARRRLSCHFHYNIDIFAKNPFAFILSFLFL